MEKKIFRSIITVAFCVLVISMIFVLQVLYTHLEKNISDELEENGNFIGAAVENEGLEYLENLKKSDIRITYINKKGKVLYDNRSDFHKMGNHKDRKEIKEAFKKGEGRSSRLSATLSVKTLYYAKLFSNGNVIRVSVKQSSPLLLLLSLFQPILVIIASILIVASIIASSVAKKIVEPINAINLDEPEENDVYDEITPLLVKISKHSVQLQRQIKEAENKQAEFITITENMNEGILIIDTKYDVLSYNKAIVNLFTNGVIPENKSVFAFNRSEDFRNIVKVALKGEGKVEVLEIKERSYEIIANPVYDNGDVVGAIILVMDVTEKVKRDNLRREFTANVSHELKTPLTSISGFAEIMKTGMVKPEDMPDMANSIYEEAQRLIVLVNDIIKLSELDEASIAYEYEKINLHELLTEIEDRLKNVIDKIDIQFYIDEKDIMIHAPKQVVSEVIYNLCDNAIKYNHQGGTVDVSLAETDAYVKIIVKDSGIGIAHVHQDRIFERFYRVDKSHSKEVGGTGLGLSIVKHDVNYLDGSIEIESNLGEGTTISDNIPKKNDTL